MIIWQQNFVVKVVKYLVIVSLFLSVYYWEVDVLKFEKQMRSFNFIEYYLKFKNWLTNDM